jgi:predicted nucleic acid-binding protein
VQKLLYDSSYIVLAMKHNLTLVMEDNKLREKAKKLVKAISLGESTTL